MNLEYKGQFDVCRYNELVLVEQDIIKGTMQYVFWYRSRDQLPLSGPLQLLKRQAVVIVDTAIMKMALTSL